jgi:hypothetical protein
MSRLPADRSFNFVELKEGIHSDAGSRSFRRLPAGVGREASSKARQIRADRGVTSLTGHDGLVYYRDWKG